MTLTQIVLLFSAVVASLAIFMIVRRRQMSFSGKKWIRIILFASIVGYLGVDFYTKQKYALIGVLVLGTIAFIYMMIRIKDR